MKKFAPISGSGSTVACLALLAALTACSEPTSPVAETSSTAFSVTPEPTAGEIEVCKDGPEGTYGFTATLDEGAGALTASFDLEAGECATIFTTTQAEPVSVVTVTEVDLPEGVVLDEVVVNSDFGAFTGTFDGPSVQAAANEFHGSAITFFNIEDDVELRCVGLTPGYWKNWKNHYTQEQFETLLAETSFAPITVSEARDILKQGGPDPVLRLEKFVLANELTLALTETTLPNPDDAALSGDCVDPEGDTTLAEALADALEVLENPGDFSRQEINELKDILDRIANMG